jgi:hypothetical protein
MPFAILMIWRQVKDDQNSDDLAVQFLAEIWDTDYEKSIKYCYENVRVYTPLSLLMSYKLSFLIVG